MIDPAMSVLMIFPAFLIGAAFGILLVLVLAGSSGLSTSRPIVFSVLGSVAGVFLFIITANWWPPVIGPFILCPFVAAIAALVGRKPSGAGRSR